MKDVSVKTSESCPLKRKEKTNVKKKVVEEEKTSYFRHVS